MGLEGFGFIFAFLVIDEMGIGVDVLVEEEGGGGGVVVVITSTGFLERFLPLCMCLSQYLESG